MNKLHGLMNYKIDDACVHNGHELHTIL